jgi:formylglycine-generating enzyme required for sulfatase activity
MVFVPGGNYSMGCWSYVDTECWANETPFHLVYLDAFEIDVTEVTVGAYGACWSAGSCETPLKGSAGCNWALSGKEQHPVNCVDWSDARSYCEWAGKRLCTEAEWEKGARGNGGAKFPWGNDPATCDYAVMTGLADPNCGTDSSWAVGSKPDGASPYGVLDMAGNVWEWTGDWYHGSYYISSPFWNPMGPDSGIHRVIRGGSVLSDASDLRASNRGVETPGLAGAYLGIRCCRPVP